MYKNFIRISVLILGNLFAFLLFWIILGALFWNKVQILLWCIIFSIIPLTFILYFEVKKITNELNNISNENKDDWEWK